METILLYATFGFVGLMVVCMVLNIVNTAKNGTPSVWGTRGLYIFGIAAAVANTIRIALMKSNNRGTILFACGVVIICLIIGLVRSEKGDPVMEKALNETDEKAEKDK